MLWLNHAAGKHNWVPFWHHNIANGFATIDPCSHVARTSGEAALNGRFGGD
jgi:hypothetical protein